PHRPAHGSTFEPLHRTAARQHTCTAALDAATRIAPVTAAVPRGPVSNGPDPQRCAFGPGDSPAGDSPQFVSPGIGDSPRQSPDWSPGFPEVRMPADLFRPSLSATPVRRRASLLPVSVAV